MKLKNINKWNVINISNNLALVKLSKNIIQIALRNLNYNERINILNILINNMIQIIIN